MNSSILSQGGRVVIPKQFREKLGVGEGDEVIWAEVDGQIVLTSRLRQIERAQSLCAKLFEGQAPRSLTDELITERRAEAAQEEALRTKGKRR